MTVIGAVTVTAPFVVSRLWVEAHMLIIFVFVIRIALTRIVGVGTHHQDGVMIVVVMTLPLRAVGPLQEKEIRLILFRLERTFELFDLV